MELIYILIGAFLLDLTFGDPRSLPHLIVGYGNLIARGEKRLNRGGSKIIKGAILTIVLVGLAYCIPYFGLQYLQQNAYTIPFIIISIVLGFYCLANKTLVKEGQAVFNTLQTKGVEEGRKRLSWIVGRDTSQLTPQQIRIATLETMSENLSDGVIAPLFYLVCFGVPGIMAYKMINTLDSMIGYKNDRYLYFGKFAAKLDDVANYIPARLTAVFMLVVTLKFKGITFVIKEGKKHSSPNAGYPEAALAYILNCQFGGPNNYGGKLVDKPYIGSYNRLINHDEIIHVSRINYYTSIVFVCLSLAVLYWANTL